VTADSVSEPANILIVDDVPENIEVLAAALGDGYEVFFATSGEEALQLASRQSIDLILLDIMMPEVDGYEVCRLFKVDPALAEIPVIFITAKTDIEDEAKGFAVGGVDYITKPVRRLTVRARVKTHLELKAKRDALKAMANVEGLENIANRATFEQMLEQENKRVHLDGTPLSVLMMGVDSFDVIAEVEERRVLHRLLEQIADGVVAATTGPLDVCAHYSGAQFAVLLPRADLALAAERGSALIDHIAALGLRYDDHRKPVSVSIGGVTADIALMNPTAKPRAQELLLTAARALEQAAVSGTGQLALRRWELEPIRF
jgi:diguanylate cyclase (GGDEF)-like protein